MRSRAMPATGSRAPGSGFRRPSAAIWLRLPVVVIASAIICAFLPAALQGLALHRFVALPEWHERLAVRIAAHDLALAAHRMLGDQEQQIERTRLAVVEVLDAAAAAGASEDELDAFLLQLRTEQCDLVSVVAAAAWVCGERARAHPVGLPAPAWATTEEIAHDRGAPVDVVEALVSETLQHGLLALEPDRGVTVTAAGHAKNAKATHA